MTKKYTVQEFVLTYVSWQSMMQRCVYKGNRKDAAFYKNVSVTPRWHTFEKFLEDMGPRPGQAFSLDRFPNKAGNYEPGNCRWATALQQAANTKRAILLTYKGETLPIAAWARRTGLSRQTIQNRLRVGMSVHKTLTMRPQEENPAYVSFSEGRLRGKKLVGWQVSELVQLAKTGEWTAVALGKRYGVSSSAICYVTKQFGIRFKKGRPRCS